MKRFKKVYNQGIINNAEIWVDTQTGINYIVITNGCGSGITPLLDENGKPIVTKEIKKQNEKKE